MALYRETIGETALGCGCAFLLMLGAIAAYAAVITFVVWIAATVLVAMGIL